MANPIIDTGYGLSQPINSLPPKPVIARRIPTTADRSYELGTLWVIPSLSESYILVSVASNSAVWNLLEVSGGAGIFTTLTSSGNTTLGTGSGTVNTLGSTGGASGTTISVGTGNLLVEGAATSTMTIGTGLTSGTIFIGSSAGSGSITLGSSTAAQTVNIGTGVNASAQVVNISSGASAADSTVNVLSGVATAGTSTLNLGTGTGAITRVVNIGTGAAVVNTINVGGTGANDINIGDTQTGGRVDIGSSMTTGVISIGGTGLQTGTVSIAPGTGTQIVNIGTGGTGVKTINIGTGAIGNVLTIGSTTAAATTTIQAGTGAINLSAGGAVKMVPATATAAAYAATLSAYVGSVSLTGQVLASAGVQVLTITNTLCTTSTPIFVTVTNTGSNDAQLTVQRIEPKSGSFDITVKNNGADALNGIIYVNFWLLQ